MSDSIISIDDVLPRLEKGQWTIIDCRFYLADITQGHQEYLAGHIPGAWYAHLDDDLSGSIHPGLTGRHPLPSIKKLNALFSKWGIEEGRQVLVYDQGHGGIAARLWWMLRWMGHEKVAVLNGGWAAYLAANGPVTNLTPETPPSAFKASPRMQWLAQVEEVNERKEEVDFCLIDARAAVRYRGEQEPIDVVAGHIPGAINLPFKENLTEAGFWKSPEELQQRFGPYVRDTEHTVVYCGSGVTACHNLLAMKHGNLPEGRLYAGSWSEWIVDEEREVV